MTSLPRKLRSVGAATCRGSLYITGGIETTSELVVDHILKINLANDRLNQSDPNAKLPVWEDVGATLLQPRYRHAAAEYKGQIWIAGGCLTNFSVTNKVEIYDPVSNVVVEGPSMLVHRDFANLLIVKGELYAVGGDVNVAGNQIIRTIEKYDESKGCWIHITVFKDSRRGFSTCAYGSRIYVFCGSSEDNQDLHTWDAYDVELQRWESEDTEKANRRKMPLIDSWGQAVTCPRGGITW